MRAELWERLAPPASLEEKLKAWFDPASRGVMKMIVEQLEKGKKKG